MLSEAVLRRLSIHAQRHVRRSFGKIPARGVAHVIDYIEAGIDQDLDMASLAEVAGMSTYHFAHRFKETVGISPHAYVLSRRVGRGQQMLRDGRASLASVAAACGFSNQAHFTTAFRGRVGVTPGAYRRMFAP